VAAPSDRPWWQTAVVYQVYPRSFADASGNGVGDLDGVRARLDHLVWLGVDALWLSPFYPSPMADGGYDVADYCGVDPLFGDLAAFDRLVADAHARGLRVIVDWVPNHSSDRHPWFVESRSGRDAARRDWYVWRDPAPDGGPPNNWLSAFGGPAWTLDEATGQYVLHSFLPEQPDLNWRHPGVRAAMGETLRFWMARGVDGFRIDVANHLLKDPALRDNPPHPAPSGGHKPTSAYDAQRHLHDRDQPDAHALYRDLRRLVDAFDATERVLLGEIHLSHDLPAWAAYAGTDGTDEIHLPLNFGLLQTPWSADALREHVARVERVLPDGAWPTYVLGSHDERRLATRLGPHGARQAALLLLTLRGTPTIYAGDELGIPDVRIPPDRQRDPLGIRSGVPGLGRDSGRTPMAWEAGPSGGFSAAPPEALWLPLHGGHETLNVAAERRRPDSLLRLYRRLLRVRRASPALHAGAYRALGAPPGVFAYERSAGEARALVALNLAAEPAALPLPPGRWRPVLSTQQPGAPFDADLSALAPHEGRLFLAETSDPHDTLL
jgi:glycosidase